MITNSEINYHGLKLIASKSIDRRGNIYKDVHCDLSMSPIWNIHVHVSYGKVFGPGNDLNALAMSRQVFDSVNMRTDWIFNSNDNEAEVNAWYTAWRESLELSKAIPQTTNNTNKSRRI